jgi:hypothetical protein
MWVNPGQPGPHHRCRRSLSRSPKRPRRSTTLPAVIERSPFDGEASGWLCIRALGGGPGAIRELTLVVLGETDAERVSREVGDRPLPRVRRSTCAFACADRRAVASGVADRRSARARRDRPGRSPRGCACPPRQGRQASRGGDGQLGVGALFRPRSYADLHRGFLAGAESKTGKVGIITPRDQPSNARTVFRALTRHRRIGSARRPPALRAGTPICSAIRSICSTFTGRACPSGRTVPSTLRCGPRLNAAAIMPTQATANVGACSDSSAQVGITRRSE